MKRHRIRKAKSIMVLFWGDELPGPHYFLEVRKDSWLPVKDPKKITHETIKSFIKKEEKTQIFHILYDSRAFRIGLIRDWEEAGAIE